MNNGSNTTVFGNQSMGAHDTNWNHVVWTFNNGTHKQYLNGVEKLSTTGVPMRTITRACHRLGIHDTGGFMNGYIKSFRVWQGTALTSSDVTQLYSEIAQPVSIETFNSQATLTATQNKLYFKYLTIPNAMTIVKDSNESTSFSSGSMFIHKFIHQMESDLNMNISLNGNSNPDVLVFSFLNSIKTSRLRRSSDNSEQDFFYYTDNTLRDMSGVDVSTWANGSDVYITVLYNQSTLSDADDLIQTSTGNQPKLDIATMSVDFGTHHDVWFLECENANGTSLLNEGDDDYAFAFHFYYYHGHHTPGVIFLSLIHI